MQNEVHLIITYEKGQIVLTQRDHNGKEKNLMTVDSKFSIQLIGTQLERDIKSGNKSKFVAFILNSLDTRLKAVSQIKPVVKKIKKK